MSNGVWEQVESAGVVAVLSLDRAEDGPPLAEALLAGGVRAMELTLRTPAAWDAFTAIRAAVPEMLAGLGTVLTPEQVTQAVDANATFAVSPGCNRRVLEAAAAAGLPFAPGVCTPSDVEVALEMALRVVKFFPAEPSGGLAFLRSMLTPYRHLGVRAIPLGGLTAESVGPYLSDVNVLAIGGSWIAPLALIRDKAWEDISERAADATRRVTEAREANA